MTGTVAHAQEVVAGTTGRIWWKPWTLVKRDLFMEGFTTPQAQLNEWRTRILKGSYRIKKCTKTDQWLVAEYQGEFEDLTRQQRLTGGVSRDGCALTSADDLQKFMADMKETMEGAQEEFNLARAGALQGAATDAPTDVPKERITEHVQPEQEYDPVLGLSITEGIMELDGMKGAADEYKRMCSKEDCEAAAIKPDEEVIDAKSMRAVAKKTAAKKLVDSLRQKLTDTFNTQAPMVPLVVLLVVRPRRRLPRSPQSGCRELGRQTVLYR